MAPEFITFIEWVTGYRQRDVKVDGALYDGAPSAWVAKEFHTRFKAGIQTIIARTAGQIMASTGIPWDILWTRRPTTPSDGHLIAFFSWSCFIVF
jgi:hypothetical protein